MDVTTYTGAQAPQESTKNAFPLQLNVSYPAPTHLQIQHIGLRWNVYIHIYMYVYIYISDRYIIYIYIYTHWQNRWYQRYLYIGIKKKRSCTLPNLTVSYVCCWFPGLVEVESIMELLRDAFKAGIHQLYDSFTFSLHIGPGKFYQKKCVYINIYTQIFIYKIVRITYM